MILSYPRYNFTVERRDGKPYLFDTLRKKWVRLEPEEWVRQNLLMYLQHTAAYPANFIAIEKAIASEGPLRRTDILIYQTDFKPWMLIECKANGVKLTQKVMDQAGRYNQKIRAPWLAICNGPEFILANIAHKKGEWHYVDTIPPFAS